MTTITLAELLYEAHSPSLYKLVSEDVTIGYDGQFWRIAIRDRWSNKEFDSREHAATFLSVMYKKAYEGQA